MNRRDSGARAHHLDDEVGLDLIHGLLPKGAEVGWLDHLRGCAPCEARFRVLAETYERGRYHYASGSAAERGGPRLVASDASRPGSKLGRAGWAWGLGLAAAAALLVLFASPDRPNPTRGPVDGSNLSHPWLPAGEADVRLRSAGAALGDSLRLGLDAYERRDLPGAQRILESLRPEVPMDLLRRVYLADIYLRQGNYALVLTTVEPLELRGLPDPWRSRGYRALIVALEAVGQRDRADALCTRLIGDAGEIGEFVRSRDRLTPRR